MSGGSDLTDAEFTASDALDTGRRGGPEPNVTLEAFSCEIPEA